MRIQTKTTIKHQMKKRIRNTSIRRESEKGSGFSSCTGRILASFSHHRSSYVAGPIRKPHKNTPGPCARARATPPTRLSFPLDKTARTTLALAQHYFPQHAAFTVRRRVSFWDGVGVLCTPCGSAHLIKLLFLVLNPIAPRRRTIRRDVNVRLSEGGADP